MKHLLYIFLLFPLFSGAQFYKITVENKILPHPLTRDSAVDQWDRSFPEYKQLNATARELLYWTNYSRENPKRFWDSAVSPILQVLPELRSSYSSSLERDLRKSTPLPLFRLNSILVSMAQEHAADIGSRHLPISHSSSGGMSFAQRFEASGLKTCGGENIGLGDDDMLLGLILLYIDYGLEAEGHRKALLNPAYTDIGIGASPYGTEPKIFYVQDFACSQQ